MKIVVAPNALKGSLTASAAARAMAAGVRRAVPSCRVELAPVADGGDGLADVLASALDAETLVERVDGPLGRPVDARWLFVPSTATAFVEMAAASGLALLRADERDAMAASTRGTGQLILAALDRGARRVVVGVGGSATTDGGTGAAAALGVRFLDEAGSDVPPCGGALSRIARIDAAGLAPRARAAVFEVLCDVDNPLTGPRGAARVYAPQKGASGAEVEELDRGLAHLADLMERDLGADVGALPGAGAAGGLAAGLHAFLGADLRPGAQVVLELVGLESMLDGASLVLTAEGQIDDQTGCGKAPVAVARAAARHGVPCIAIAGAVSLERAALREAGFTAVFSLCNGPMSLGQAVSSAAELIAAAAEEAVRTFAAGRPTA